VDQFFVFVPAQQTVLPVLRQQLCTNQQHVRCPGRVSGTQAVRNDRVRYLIEKVIPGYGFSCFPTGDVGLQVSRRGWEPRLRKQGCASSGSMAEFRPHGRRKLSACATGVVTSYVAPVSSLA
jgi:hypothetical protein